MSYLVDTVSQFVLKGLQEGKCPEEIIKLIQTNAENALDGEINLSYWDEFTSVLFQIAVSQPPKNIKEQDIAFETTLSCFELDTIDKILYNDLKALIKYDKIFYIEDIPLYTQLFLALFYVQEAKKKLPILNQLLCEESLLKRGVAGAKSKYIDEVINPKISTFEEAFELSHCQHIARFQKLYESFKCDPLETDIILREMNRFPSECLKSVDYISLQKDLFIPSRSFLNCSKTRLEPNDIYESTALFIFSIYRVNSYMNRVMNNNQVLSASRIAKSVNTVLEYIFEVDESNYNYSHVTRDIQEKASFFDLTLYEFRTQKNYKPHPFLEKPLSKEMQAIFVS